MNVAKRLVLVAVTIAVAVAFGLLTGEVSVGAEGCARRGPTACPERPPARLPAPDPMNCRDRALYPDVRAAVRCVWRTNGLAGEWPTAEYIAWRESRFVPTAHNSCCYGIYALHLGVWGEVLARYGEWWDPVANTAAAVAIYRAHGWQPWACC